MVGLAVNDTGQRDDRPRRPSGQLLLRYWREPRPRGGWRLRGTILDLSGAMLGAFEREQGLFALLHRLIGAEPGTQQDDKDAEGPP